MASPDSTPDKVTVTNFLVPEQYNVTRLGEALSNTFTLSRTGATVLRETFFDTFDWELQRHRYTLRHTSGRLILSNGSPRTPDIEEQCSKKAVSRDGILDLPDGALKERVVAMSSQRALISMSESYESLDEIAVLNEDQKTVGRLRFRVVKDKTLRKTRSCTLSVVPLRGYAEEADRIRSCVVEHGFIPVANASVNRIDMGLTEWGSRSLRFAMTREVMFSPDSSLLEVMMRIAEQCLHTVHQLEFGVIEDIDTEFLHSLRVSIRKLRSMQKLFPGALAKRRENQLKADLKQLGNETNALRDLDVYLLSKSAFQALLPEALHPGLERIFKTLAQRRTLAFKKLVEFLNSEAYRDNLERWRHLCKDAREPGKCEGPHAEANFQSHAGRFIDKQYRKIVRQIRSIDEQSEEAEIHRLRIQFKQMRYAIDFAQCVFEPQTASKLSRRFRKLQNALGRFNDECMQAEFLHDYLAKAKSARNADTNLIASLEALLKGLDRQHGKTLKSILSRMGKVDSPRNLKLIKRLPQYP